MSNQVYVGGGFASQDAPRRTQDAPRHAPNAPKMNQDAPKTPQDAPRGPQDGPKTLIRAIVGRFLVEFWLIFGRFFRLKFDGNFQRQFSQKALKTNEQSMFFLFSVVEVGTKNEQTSIGKSGPRRDVSLCDPKTFQEGTKTPQDAPKTPQDGPKTLPRRLQDTPRPP